MKYKYVLVIIAAIALSAIKVFAQEKPVVPDSSLLKKYEVIKQNLSKQAEQIEETKTKQLGEYLEKSEKLQTTYRTIEALASEERKRLDALKPKLVNEKPQNKKEVKK